MILECIDRFRSDVRQFVMSGWSESQTHLILHISYDGHNDNDCRLQHREQSQPSSVQQHIILLCAKPAEKKKNTSLAMIKAFAFTFHKYKGARPVSKIIQDMINTIKYFLPLSQFLNPIPYSVCSILHDQRITLLKLYPLWVYVTK